MRRLKSYLEDDEWRAKRVRIACDAQTQKQSYLKYQTKIAKACINFQPSKIYIFNHNSREEAPQFEAKYTIKELEKFNEYSCSANEANLKFKELYDEASTNYFNRTKQRIQTKNLRISAVINLNENHNLQDVENLAKKIETLYGLQPLQIAIHRDEGHFLKGIDGNKLKDENGDFIFDPNLHAHIEFFTLDKQGINRYKVRDRYRINKELQTLAANELGMERGKDYAKLGIKPPRHLNRQEYAKAKAISEREAFKKQIMAKESENLKANLKDINEINKELREQLKVSGANRTEYAKLEQEIKEYRQKIRDKELISKDELNKFRAEFIAKLDEKSAKIDELEAENLTIKERNRGLEKQNLELNELLKTQEFESVIEVTAELSKEQQDKLFLEQVKTQSKYSNEISFLNLDDYYRFDEIQRHYEKQIDSLNIADDDKFSLKLEFEYGRDSMYISEKSVKKDFFENVKKVVSCKCDEFEIRSFNDKVKELVKKKNNFAKRYLELKKAWYGDNDSNGKELTATQLKDFIQRYLDQKKELEKLKQTIKEPSAFVKAILGKNEPVKKKEIER